MDKDSEGKNNYLYFRAFISIWTVHKLVFFPIALTFSKCPCKIISCVFLLSQLLVKHIKCHFPPCPKRSVSATVIVCSSRATAAVLLRELMKNLSKWTLVTAEEDLWHPVSPTCSFFTPTQALCPTLHLAPPPTPISFSLSVLKISSIHPSPYLLTAC